jgi:hypothetical protein
MATTTASFQGFISNGTSGVAGTILNITTMTAGTIQLGMNVSNASTLANTTILAFLTGTGTTGTYTVGKSQAVGQVSNTATFIATTASKITALDYNYIQGIANRVMGTPVATNGYNTTVLSSQIPGSVTAITATQWNNLRTELLNAYLHQGSIGSLPSPTVPTKITAPGGLISSDDFSKYIAIANSINANPLAIAASGQSSLTSTPYTRTAAWSSPLTQTITLTWPSANATRGFFNSGGKFNFFASLIGYQVSDPGYAKSVDWNTLLTNMKVITMNYNSTTSTGSFTTIAATTGFYQLTTSDIELFNRGTASPSYTNNNYKILARVNNVTTPTVLTFTIQFVDGAPINPPFGADEPVTGTLTSTFQVFYSTGNVTATYPTLVNSGP